jgi:hypothetical protein
MNELGPDLDRSSPVCGTLRDSSRCIRLDRRIAVAAALFVHLAQVPATRAAELKIPPAVQQALEENARQLSPISVTCTMRVTSSLSPAETLERLKLANSFRPDRFFSEHPSRIVWQDQKIYASFKFLSGEVGDNETTSLSESTFDGQVVSNSSLYNPSKEALARLKKMGGGAGPIARNITREPIAKVLQRQTFGLGIGSVYFQPAIGLLLESKSRGAVAGGGVDEYKSHAESAVLNCLQNGWKLISVENTLRDSHRSVRIEMQGDNPIRSSAVAYDLDNYRQMVQRNRAANEKQLARLTPQQKEMILGSQRQQEERVRIIEEQRKLPAMRRYVFYLDPELHYAVRRFEQSYGPDTLLARSDCSHFEQIPGRQLWLPRRVETQLHEYYSVPETVFKDAFLTQILEVSAIDGSRVPEELFKLDYTEPGTMVRDGTDPAAKSKDGYLSYTVPARPEELPGVIERARNGENMVQFFGGPPLAAAPLVEKYRRGALLTIVLCNVAMLGAGAVYLVWRRRAGGAG